MTRLALLVEPDNGQPWMKSLLGRLGTVFSFSFCHQVTGRAVEVSVVFYSGQKAMERCRRLGVDLLGAGRKGVSGEGGATVGIREEAVKRTADPPLNLGHAFLVNCLQEVWRRVMRGRGVNPAEARVVVVGESALGLLCVQAFAQETRHLTVIGRLGDLLEPLRARILYETGVAVSRETEVKTVYRDADTVILTGEAGAEGRVGELTAGDAWVYSFAKSKPLMVRIPGKVYAKKGFIHSIVFCVFSKTLPGWVIELAAGKTDTEGVFLPADYAEALLLALEGRDLYQGEVRLKHMHRIGKLGIDYESTLVRLDFP